MNDIKNKIVDGIKHAQSNGITLVSEDWGSAKTKCACALGCLLIANDITLSSEDDPEDNAQCAADILGVPTEWVENFIFGFDDDIAGASPEQYQDALQLGIDIRKELNPITNTDYINSLDPMTLQLMELVK